MKLVRSTLSDVPIIMGFIHDAQLYLASLKIDQWQDGYPDEGKIELDINNNDSYLVVDDTETSEITKLGARS
nr:GNAT family N-acetyltransferase [Bacteroidota bacterium]